jgi:two-component system phosphate regulon sensor histidine kinase PhoR
MPAGRAGSRPLARSLVIWNAVAVLGVLLVLGVVVDRALESRLLDQLTDRLVADARAVQASLAGGAPPADQVERLAEAIDARITVIGTDGVVVADSLADPATLENHATRPEVREALAGRVGVATRTSASVGVPYRYVALPPQGDLIVRVALPLTDVQASVGAVRPILLTGFLLAALAGVAAILLTVGRLTRPLGRVTEAVGRVVDVEPNVPVPEEGTAEIRRLARAVNAMQREVASRIEAVERDRATRDAILSALEEGVALFDAEGTAVYHNDRATRLLGASPSDAARLTPTDLRLVVEEAGSGGAARVREVTDGLGGKTLLAAADRLPDGTVLLIVRDVTQARTADLVRRDFVANASHELKTPVASIQALAETIATASADDPDSIPRFAEQLEREALRLSRIISDLLDLSRLEGGGTDQQVVDVGQVVRDEVHPYFERASAAGLRLDVDANGGLSVRGSARDLGLLVRNLVENAIQYTRPGGEVRVRASRDGRTAVVEVSDNGVGIPSRDQGRVFERFYRVDRARSRETGGTGLGLSIVRHVAENHGGQVLLESELGRGSTFTVRLPLAGPG